MIFARRYLQRALNELRTVIDSSTVTSLASRLNRPGKDRLAVMWEVAALHALSSLGSLRNEIPLPSGRRPDLVFDNGSLAFTADITVSSDDGLDDQNPFEKLSFLIEACKNRLGLPIGGMDLHTGDRLEHTSRGTKKVLKIPPASKLPEFIQQEIEPQLKSQIAEGNKILKLEIENKSTSIYITIDPTKSPYNTGFHAAYDIPTIKDQNPLFNALRSKAKQLHGALGITGIIVGDGDSQALSGHQFQRNGVSVQEIVQDFLRQNTSIHFVFLLSVRESRSSCSTATGRDISLIGTPFYNKKHDPSPELEALLQEFVSRFPCPVLMPDNAARQSRKSGYKLGFHGGHKMSKNSIKISARELLEVLAGRRAALHYDCPLLKLYLDKGCLPSSIKIIPGGENESDNWVEFEFGSPDPSISPFY